MLCCTLFHLSKKSASVAYALICIEADVLGRSFGIVLVIRGARRAASVPVDGLSLLLSVAVSQPCLSRDLSDPRANMLLEGWLKTFIVLLRCSTRRGGRSGSGFIVFLTPPESDRRSSANTLGGHVMLGPVPTLLFEMCEPTSSPNSFLSLFIFRTPLTISVLVGDVSAVFGLVGGGQVVNVRVNFASSTAVKAPVFGSLFTGIRWGLVARGDIGAAANFVETGFRDVGDRFPAEAERDRPGRSARIGGTRSGGWWQRDGLWMGSDAGEVTDSRLAGRGDGPCAWIDAVLVGGDAEAVSEAMMSVDALETSER